MLCHDSTIHNLSWGFIIGGFLYLLHQVNNPTPYGRYVELQHPGVMVPAKAAWLIQELPSFLVPVLLMLTTESSTDLGRYILLWTFILHYFQRTFIYALLTKGRPCPLYIVVLAVVFCSVNGFLQGHYMLHCARYEAAWYTDVRFILGLFLFFSGMAINIHSDHILRNLRKPGEITYKIPKGNEALNISSSNSISIIHFIIYSNRVSLNQSYTEYPDSKECCINVEILTLKQYLSTFEVLNEASFIIVTFLMVFMVTSFEDTFKVL
uniref:Steroid-5-alpha-reductase, alpha polypeptide 2a n=1 Tax=Astyanax mexicanus TaxID=7994 RepID=A0A8B9JK13_ASTMX